MSNKAITKNMRQGTFKTFSNALLHFSKRFEKDIPIQCKRFFTNVNIFDFRAFLMNPYQQQRIGPSTNTILASSSTLSKTGGGSVAGNNPSKQESAVSKAFFNLSPNRKSNR